MSICNIIALNDLNNTHLRLDRIDGCWPELVQGRHPVRGNTHMVTLKVLHLSGNVLTLAYGVAHSNRYENKIESEQRLCEEDLVRLTTAIEHGKEQ